MRATIGSILMIIAVFLMGMMLVRVNVIDDLSWVWMGVPIIIFAAGLRLFMYHGTNPDGTPAAMFTGAQLLNAIWIALIIGTVVSFAGWTKGNFPFIGEALDLKRERTDIMVGRAIKPADTEYQLSLEQSRDTARNIISAQEAASLRELDRDLKAGKITREKYFANEKIIRARALKDLGDNDARGKAEAVAEAEKVNDGWSISNLYDVKYWQARVAQMTIVERLGYGLGILLVLGGTVNLLKGLLPSKERVGHFKLSITALAFGLALLMGTPLLNAMYNNNYAPSGFSAWVRANVERIATSLYTDNCLDANELWSVENFWHRTGVYLHEGQVADIAIVRYNIHHPEAYQPDGSVIRPTADGYDEKPPFNLSGERICTECNGWPLMAAIVKVDDQSTTTDPPALIGRKARITSRRSGSGEILFGVNMPIWKPDPMSHLQADNEMNLLEGTMCYEITVSGTRR